MLKPPYVEGFCTSKAFLPTLTEFGYGACILEESRSKALENVSKDHAKLVIATRRTVYVNASRKVTYDALKADLIKARDEVDIVFMAGDHEFFLRRILESNDAFLIDGVHVSMDLISILKPSTARLLKEKSMLIEMSIVDLLKSESRGKRLANGRHVVRTFVRRLKKANNFVLSTGATTGIELRTVDEMKAIGAILGLRPDDVEMSLRITPYRLVEQAYARRMEFIRLRDKMGIVLSDQTKPTTTTTPESHKRKRTKPSDDVDDRRKRAALWNDS